jgi:thiol-disulfide isomerase/thioredoxin
VSSFLKLKAGLIFMLLVALLAGCGGSGSGSGDKKKDVSLDTIHNGIVVYYDDSDASTKLLSGLDELAVSDSFELVKIHVTKDQDKLDKYEEQNKKVVDAYKEVRTMEAKLSKLKSDVSAADANTVKNGVMLNYRKALNLVKNEKLSTEQKAELDKLVKEVALKQELKEDEIRKLLDLQTDARLKVPVYSSYDGDSAKEKLPVMKVIYEGNLRTSFAFGQKPIPAETMSNAEQLKYYLKEKAWISNFQDSSDGAAIEKKLKNKDTFMLLIWGNSCPHCHKVMPVLDKLSDQTGVKVERIDTFNEGNNKAYSKLVSSGKYGLTDVKWVPTLVYIKDGKQEATIGVYDWAIENAAADLGYDLDETKIKAFVEKAK